MISDLALRQDLPAFVGACQDPKGRPVACASTVDGGLVSTVLPTVAFPTSDPGLGGDVVASSTSTPASSETPTTTTPTVLSTQTLPATIPSSITFVNSSMQPTQTSTAQPQIASSKGSNGISNGAVAGIAIAMLIVGGAIAFLAAMLLFKRRRQGSMHPYKEPVSGFASTSTLHGKSQPYTQISQTPIPTSTAMDPAHSSVRQELDLANMSNSSDFLATLLPPAAGGQVVKSRVAALLAQIQHHVDFFYRDVHATMTPTMKKDLTRFGSDSLNMVEALQATSRPTAAIKNALAGFILSIVNSEADDQATLFPTEIAGLKGEERLASSPDHQAAYMLYKRIAVQLYKPSQSLLQSRLADIREACEHFSLTFFPWANPTHSDQDKDNDLLQVIQGALDLSIWLYGQPYVYDYVWEDVGQRGTVVAPGLSRFTDSRGRTLSIPERILDPVIVLT